MEEKLTVFISSRINDEMKRARHALREAIAELPLTRPWLFEEAPASADLLDESYLRWVGRCDLFILLLGEDITDPVKVEWETATQARKPRLVFLKKGSQDDAAWEFAKGLDVKWKEYRTLAELKREVQAAVGDELIKGYRAYGVSEDERAGLQEHVRGLQAGGVTIGEDVVFGDKVGGDKVARDKVVVTTHVRDVRGSTVITAGRDVHGNIYVGPPSQNPAEALRIFRRVLVATCRHLPLRGVDLGTSDPTRGQQQFDLAQVYVDLDTKTQVSPTEKEEKRRRELFDERETRPLGILEATVDNRRLVILGDPGSGKSTFLNHLALCLAAYSLEPEGSESECRDWLARLPGWPGRETDALPIPVILRDFAHQLPEDAKRAEPRHLWNFIVSRLEAQNLGFAAGPLHQALEEGKAVVLLDGLDEIPTREQRTFIRDAVAAFAGRYPRSRMAITCRTLSYQEPAWQLEGFPAFELAPFNEEKIDYFIGAWYDELARFGVVKTEEAGGLARRLQQAVRRPDLWRLAPNPLLLTVMALVHTHKGHLPDARALLYEDTVDVLLWRWEQIKAGGEETAPRLRRLLLEAECTGVDLKGALWRLAFEAHQEGGSKDETLADIGELQLQNVLAGLHPKGSRDWAHQVIEAMKLRTGLLLERTPGAYTFPHRTLQEYLAAAHLSTQADFAKQAARLAEAGAFWREVVLLAVGRLVYLFGDTAKPLALAGELCPVCVVDEEVAWQKIWLAGEVLGEIGVNRVQDSDLGRDLAQRVSHRLANLVGKGHLSSVERAAAGRVLAKLGDPRPGVGVDSVTGLPDILWCYVAPGPFVMGSMDTGEKPQHRNESITEGYLISRYPITNAQFAAFAEAGGYQEQRYWTEAGWKWKRERERNRLDDSGEPFNLPNHPVVGVYWHEAIAFCRWSQEQLQVANCKLQIWHDSEIQTLNLDPETTEVRLPSEAEWEKAARGTDGRVFPWGEESDPERANYGDTGIGTTSAVGCFPGGASPYGVEDLSGNVWEWTQSRWKDYPYDPEDGREDLGAGTGVRRVMRGGAFAYGARRVRCAVRRRYFPGGRGDGRGGFRVVASPVHL